MSALHLSAALFAALFACALPLSAQEAGTPPAAVPTQSAPPPKVARPVVTLTFQGGSMVEFIMAVRDHVPDANIVLADNAARAGVPPLVLRKAGLAQALEAACQVVEAPFEVRVKELRGDGEWVYTITAPKAPPRVRSETTPPPPPAQRIVSLQELTRGEGALRVDIILSAIELACESAESPVVLRFHGDSGLLIARGTAEQMEALETVVAVLRKARPQSRGSTPAGGVSGDKTDVSSGATR